MNSANSQEVELIVFRYIDTASAAAFRAKMGEWGISAVPLRPSTPSAPLRYWDYPDFEREAKDVNLVAARVGDIGGITQRSLELTQFEVISLREIPNHYPFIYVLTFLFKARIPTSNSKQQTLLRLIGQTQHAKRFTDALCGKAPYRPVYWFLPEFATELRGLRGTLNDVLSPAGTKVQVERVFPEASYAVYGTSPSREDFRVTDLALVSVVAHVVERGYRSQMYSLTEAIHDKVAKAPANSELPNSITELSQRIGDLYRLQYEIRPSVDDFFAIRKHLIRIKGLVQRVRQVCGGAQEKNIFDLVCDDAITSIEDEISMSQEEISLHLQDVSERLQTVYRHLNDRYSQLNTHRTQNLQRIGLYLQATGAAFLTFQVLNGLIPPDLQFFYGQFRWSSILTLTILVGATTYWGLKRSLKAGGSQ